MIVSKTSSVSSYPVNHGQLCCPTPVLEVRTLASSCWLEHETGLSDPFMISWLLEQGSTVTSYTSSPLPQWPKGWR